MLANHSRPISVCMTLRLLIQGTTCAPPLPISHHSTHHQQQHDHVRQSDQASQQPGGSLHMTSRHHLRTNPLPTAPPSPSPRGQLTQLTCRSGRTCGCCTAAPDSRIGFWGGVLHADMFADNSGIAYQDSNRRPERTVGNTAFVSH
jgi:hypothetical protein